MKSNTKLFFPLAFAMLLTACGGGSSSAAPSEPAKSSEPSAASSQAPASSEAAPSSQAPASGPAVDSSEPAEDYYVKNPTTVYFMSSFRDEYQQAIDAIIEDFKEIEPNVTVMNIKETGSYDDVKKKVEAEIATQDHPDMFVAYPDSVADIMQYRYVDDFQPYCADMTPFIENPNYGWTEEDLQDIYPAYLEEGMKYAIPGVYSLPMCKSTECLYYNASALIGLNLASIDPTINGGKAISDEYMNSLTWEELFEHLCPALVQYNEQAANDAKILTGAGLDTDKDYGILGYDSDANLFITLAEQYGYDYTAIDEYGDAEIKFVNDGMKNLMKMFRNAYDKRYIFTGGTWEKGKGYTSSAFTDNSSLMGIGSTAGASKQVSDDFVTGVAKIPYAKNGTRKVINQGPSLAMLSHKKDGVVDQDRLLASWLFYRYFSTATNSSYWSRTTSYLPLRASVSEDEDYLDYCDIENKKGVALNQALVARYGAQSVGKDLYSSPVFKGSGEARNQVGALFANCMIDKNLNDNIDKLFDDAYNETLKKMGA